MILLTGILFGLMSGLLIAKLNNRPYQPIQLKGWWLVFIAFLPQLAIFHIPLLSSQIPDRFAPLVLVSTQAILLIFTWLNRTNSGIIFLGIGLFFNFLVIILNQGMMPISPETIEYLLPENSEYSYQIGDRLEDQKDIILPIADTKLWVLSDRLVLPKWLNYPIAFSVGDIFIAFGAFVITITPGLLKRNHPATIQVEVY